MSLEDAVQQGKPFSIQGKDLLPLGIGLWRYSVRSTRDAKLLRESAESYELRDTINSFMLCAYSIATVVGTAWGIHKLYDLLK
jgi:hypothetical protein